MQGKNVFGDCERNARAANLRRVHVAVDPDGGTRFVGIAADNEERYVAAFGALADGSHAKDLRMLLRPGGDCRGEFCVLEIFLAEHLFSLRRIYEAAIIACPGQVPATLDSSGPPRFIKANARGDGDIQAFDGAGERNADDAVAKLARQSSQATTLRPQHPREGTGDVCIEQVLAAR